MPSELPPILLPPGQIDTSRPECKETGNRLKRSLDELKRLLRAYRVADAREKERLAPLIENEEDRSRALEEELLEAGCFISSDPAPVVEQLHVNHLELTQSTQYYRPDEANGTGAQRDNFMQLIESKPLLVRAYLTSDLTGFDYVEGELFVRGYNPSNHKYDILRTSVRELAATLVWPDEPSERQNIFTTLNFLVPQEVCWGRTLLYVRAWFRGHQADPAGMTPSYQTSSSQYAQFLGRRTPIIHCYRITLTQVFMTPGPPPTQTTTTFTEPTFADCQATMNLATRMWPVPTLTIRDRGARAFRGQLTTAAQYDAVRLDIQSVRDGTTPTPADNELYVALLPDHTRQFPGGGVVGQQGAQSLQSTVNLNQLFAHELGHWLLPGDDHVSDPMCINPNLALTDIDPNYPDYPNAVQRAGIGEWGVDTRGTPTLFRPETPEIMSYCNGAQWVSPYNYQRALAGTVLNIPSTVSAEIPATHQEKLLIAIRRRRDGDVELRWALHLPGEPTRPSMKDAVDVRIELYDGLDILLASSPCHRPADRAALDPYEDFQELMPWSDSVETVVVRSGEVELARWSVEDRRDSAPVRRLAIGESISDSDESGVRLSWSADDDSVALHQMLRYTPDDGRTWIPLANGVEGTEFDVLADVLRGLSDVRFQLAASTGFRTMLIETQATVSRSGGGRTAEIISPSDDDVVPYGEPVVLTGATSSRFDGRADDAHAYWSSNRDGFLGDGLHVVAQRLSVGRHVLRLVITEPSGAELIVTRMLLVTDPGIEPEPGCLS